MRDTRQPVGGVPVDDRVRHLGQHAVDQPVAQPAQPRRELGATGDGHFERGGETDGSRHVQRAGTDVALLAAAVQQRHTGDVAPQQQSTYAVGTTELVPGDGHRIGTAGREVDGQRPRRLHRVGVERHAVLVRDRRKLGHRLDGADFVVRPHDGDERDRLRVAREGGPQHGGMHEAVAVDLEPADLGALLR